MLIFLYLMTIHKKLPLWNNSSIEIHPAGKNNSNPSFITANLEINSDFQCCNNRGVWDLKKLIWILRSEYFDIGRWILLDQSFISSYHWRNKNQYKKNFNLPIIFLEAPIFSDPYYFSDIKHFKWIQKEQHSQQWTQWAQKNY